MLEPAVRQKIEDLINRSNEEYITSRAFIGSEDINYIAKCVSWITESTNIIDVTIPLEQNVYRQKILEIANEEGAHLGTQIASMAAILSSLLIDSDAGLIADFGNKIRAETFDEFLEHADIYQQKDKNKPQAFWPESSSRTRSVAFVATRASPRKTKTRQTDQRLGAADRNHGPASETGENRRLRQDKSHTCPMG